MKAEDKAALIKQAKYEYTDTYIQVDDNARVSGTPSEAWVQAWVWVEMPEEENETPGN